MHKQIVLNSFSKIREEILNDSGVPPSDSSCAKELSIHISEKFPFGEKSLRNLYKAAREDSEVEIKQPHVVLELCRFLGYKDYEDYLLENHKFSEDFETSPDLIPDSATKFSLKRFYAKNKTTIGIILIGIILLISLSFFDRTRWMIWEDNAYIEASFDSEKIQDGSLKIFKQDRIDNFTQINPDCKTLFFNANGSVALWYGKNSNGKLEYFTDHGLHPITGKTLKPITKYMITKYICPSKVSANTIKQN